MLKILERKQNMKKTKIYCAGPLFNTKEKEEMAEIAQALEINGFEVFLPHRDGLEFANLSQTFKGLGLSDRESELILNKSIYALDVFQVLDSDGLILNLNGRVPDEGAIAEAGIAWSAGKKICIYKDDVRSLIRGNDNPLVLGLSDFKTIKKKSEIPHKFRELFKHDNELTDRNSLFDNSNLENLYETGSKIISIMENSYSDQEICAKLLNILGDDRDTS
jgi:nucleoside 2-deoxyribosyltransferase